MKKTRAGRPSRLTKLLRTLRAWRAERRLGLALAERLDPGIAPVPGRRKLSAEQAEEIDQLVKLTGIVKASAATSRAVPVPTWVRPAIIEEHRARAPMRVALACAVIGLGLSALDAGMPFALLVLGGGAVAWGVWWCDLQSRRMHQHGLQWLRLKTPYD